MSVNCIERGLSKSNGGFEIKRKWTKIKNTNTQPWQVEKHIEEVNNCQ